MANKRKNPPAKWVLPDVVNPPDHICFKIPVPNNKYHLAAFRGALLNLASAAKWGDDTAHTALQVAKVWQDIYDQVVATACQNPTPGPSAGTILEISPMEGLFQVICDDSGKCVLQYRCDVCSPWVTVANVNDLIANPPGTGNQPGPGGGTANYCNVVGPDDGVVIPIPVSTGDKIEVTSFEGNWGDGTLAQYCFDGNTFFIECVGSGAHIVGGSDVVPTAAHMSAVVRFSTGYFPLYPGGSLTIPAGITNEQPWVKANKDPAASGNGAVNACFKITNNAAATFSHHFDFTTSPGGWVASGAASPAPGQWLAGQGWSWVDFVLGGNHMRGIYITRAIASRTINSISFTFDRTSGGTDSGGDDWIEMFTNSTSLGNVNFATSDPSGSNLVHISSTTSAGTTLISLLLVSSNFNPATFSGNILLKSMDVAGLGVDPF